MPERDSRITDTRDVTYYLRGVAILVVVANHYVNRYVTDNFGGYGNGAVAIFFVLSGYGIYHSLNRTFRSKVSLGTLFDFYSSRALRIFPLYWLFLLVNTFTGGETPSIWVWLGIPIQLAPSVGWFVTLLIQCYLLAPLLYVAIQKLGTAKYLWLVICAVLLVWAAAIVLGARPWVISVYGYRHMYASHILLFSLGLAMPTLRSPPSVRRAAWLLLPGSFLLFWFTLYYTRAQYVPWSQWVAPLFMFSTFGFCYLMIAVKPRLILGRVLILLGTYSYSVFLFHVSLYDGLTALGALEHGSWTGLVFVLLALPPFVMACILVEKLTGRLTNRLRARLERAM